MGSLDDWSAGVRSLVASESAADVFETLYRVMPRVAPRGAILLFRRGQLCGSIASQTSHQPHLGSSGRILFQCPHAEAEGVESDGT